MEDKKNSSKKISAKLLRRNQTGFKNLFRPSSVITTIILMAIISSWNLFLLCFLSPPSIPSGRPCLEEFSTVEDVSVFITYPFSSILAWTIGDSGLSVVLGFLLYFLVVLFVVYYMRRLIAWIKRRHFK